MTASDLVGSERALSRRRGAQAAVVLLPFGLALLVGAVILVVAGRNPFEIYALMAREAAGGSGRLAATLSATTPLLFTGIATAVAFRAGVFNIGVEGSFVAGGLAAAVAGFSLPGVPALGLIALGLLAGAVAGAAVAAGPGLLRAYWGVDEVVTTLMANFIALGITGWLVNTIFLAPGVANSASPLVAEQARLARLLPPSSLNVGLLLALVAVVAYAILLHRRALGFELRMVGINPRFSFAQGISVPRTIVAAMLLSGIVGGLGGAVHALGVVGRFAEGFSPGYGFTGIAVALLGRNSPIGVTLAALLFGGLASAGATMQLFSDVPLDLINVLQGTVMIFAVVQLVRDHSRTRAADR